MNNRQLLCSPNNFLIRVPQHFDWFRNDWHQSRELRENEQIEDLLNCLKKFSTQEMGSEIDGVLNKILNVRKASQGITFHQIEYSLSSWIISYQALKESIQVALPQAKFVSVGRQPQDSSSHSNISEKE